MEKSNVIMCSRATSRQLVIASLSILLGLIAQTGSAFAGLGGNILSPKASQLPAGQHGGQVMPPSAKPFGLSLRDMAEKTAQFTTSVNNPLFFPPTPFQILYFDPSTENAVVIGNVLSVTGTKTFPSVQKGMKFYVPIVSFDDSPPVLGTFPTSSSTVASYWFNSSQLGGTVFNIVVDGEATSIGATYLVGPITTLLQDGPGPREGHIITMGVFLTPLSKGSHTVKISARFEGALITSFFGNFLETDFTYTVIVQ
jgi:hypothetical protein